MIKQALINELVSGCICMYSRTYIAIDRKKDFRELVFLSESKFFTQHGQMIDIEEWVEVTTLLFKASKLNESRLES